MYQFLMKYPYLKYLVSGSFFTILGPLIFYISTIFFPNILAIIISETVLHIFRYFSYKYFIFPKLNSNPRKYIFAISPIVLFNLVLVYLSSNYLEPKFIAILMIIFSSSFGYLWSVFILKK